MGKNLLGVNDFKDLEPILKQGLSVKYVKYLDSFKFSGYRLELEEAFSNAGVNANSIKGLGVYRHVLFAKNELMYLLVDADKVSSVTDRFQVGYKTRELIYGQPGDLNLLEKNEYEFLGKNSKSNLDSNLSKDTYHDICIWQYAFLINATILNKAKANPGVWFEVGARTHAKTGGRVKNSIKGSNPLSSATELLRCQYNKQVAVFRGIWVRYLDAWKEECKLLKKKFIYSECLQSWKNELK